MDIDHRESTLDFAPANLAKGRFASLEVLTDEVLFRSTGVRMAFTSRLGGVSEPPFDALDLASHVGDDPVSVERNRELLLGAFGAKGFPLLNPRQVHGDCILAVESSDRASLEKASAAAEEGADGILVAVPRVGALLCFADCAPVVIVTPHGRFAVVHAGWRGAVASIAARAVHMLAQREDPSGFNAYIGPYIHSECFEVGEDVASLFAARFGDVAVSDRNHVDLGGALRCDLLRAGLDSSRIADAGVCTSCSCDEYYSYRKDGGRTGRHGAFAMKIEGKEGKDGH